MLDLTPLNLNQQEQHERDQRWCEAQQGVIDAMVNGTMPYAAPWADARFQKMVCKALAQGGSWRREAEKLKVIREVFGGIK
jgi:hypothetical protein